MKWLWLVVISLMLFPSLMGCQQPGTQEEEAHHIPEHLPADFDQALTRIEQLAVHLTDGVALEQKPVEVDVSTELRDVVRWLPELAAQSDLNEDDWNAVDAATRELIEGFEKSKEPLETWITQQAILAQIAQLPNALAEVRQHYRDMQIPEIVTEGE